MKRPNSAKKRKNKSSVSQALSDDTQFINLVDEISELHRIKREIVNQAAEIEKLEHRLKERQGDLLKKENLHIDREKGLNERHSQLLICQQHLDG